jgi:RNA polymerase subunit RPABC4/transcription elongation factor Spt4
VASVLQPCRKCGEQVSIWAKTCPKCSGKTRDADRQRSDAAEWRGLAILAGLIILSLVDVEARLHKDQPGTFALGGDRENRIRVIDLGLRLADVEAMSLESEEVSLGMAGRSKIRERLKRNGATQAEIDFLLGGRRVELNAMPSDQFIEFVSAN